MFLAGRMLLLMLSFLAVSTTVQSEDVIIADDATLKGYLCNGTVHPHTNLILSKQEFNILMVNKSQGQYCSIENTTDISISPSQELLDSGVHVDVNCLVGIVFGFFNVTNLTISSVIFYRCADILPTEAVRYINGTKQFWYYYDVPSTLFFNHCYNLVLHNVSVNTPQTLYSGYDIIGVNLCGESEITALLPAQDFESYPLIKMLIYFTDSNMTAHSNMECKLSIKSNIISSDTEDSDLRNILKYLIRSPRKLPISIVSDFALYIAQQDFDVEVNVSIGPQNKSLSSHNLNVFNEPMNVVIGFFNSISASHISFRGLGIPYKTCVDRENHTPAYNISHRSLVLVVVFYETPYFQGKNNMILSPLLIRDTAFTGLHDIRNEENSVAMLQVLKFPGQSLYRVIMENISWCENDLTDNFKPSTYSLYPFNAQHLSEKNSPFEYSLFKGHLYLEFENIYMHGNKFVNDPSLHKSQNFLMYFFNVKEIVMSGENYFAENAGGTVINVEASNLTLTGNLTIRDGYAPTGGGIRLDSYSTLYLKEPLVAGFYDNKADQGSAIYAPVHADHENGRQKAWECIAKTVCDIKQSISTIQIVPKYFYSIDNITNISITLYFRNNRNNRVFRSLYAPHFSFFGTQTSKSLLFGPSDWDYRHSQFAYTTLISALFKDGMDPLDKYTSLSNGICIQPQNGLWDCRYIDKFYFNDTILPKCHQNVALYNISAYPGAKAFSVLNMDTRLYDVGYCSHTPASLHWSYEYKYQEYSYWDTTILEGNSTKSFRINYDQVIESDRDNTFMILLTNTEANVVSISVVQLSMNTREYCPLGFQLTNKGVCDCILPLQRHNYSCNIDSLTFASKFGYWTGVAKSQNGSTTILYDDNCPPNYCDAELHDFLLASSPTEMSQCLGNRVGVLCGECKENHSAVFGSDSCYNNCTNLYLLTIPLYALAGFLLVLLLFLLRLTVATGNINGFIFYANALGLVMSKLTENESASYYVDTIHIANSLLNLDLGFPLCFYKGMTVSVKAGLQFVFPAYLWSIVIGLIIMSKYSIKLSGLISRSSVQVLATLFYLSFSKLLHTVIQVFSSTTLNIVTYSDEVNYSEREEVVWFFSGKEYGHGDHVVLLSVAIVFTLLLLPFSLLVTFSYCFIGLHTINRFKPFIDAYSGPFKDKYRFWFGLRLWATVVLFAVDGALQGTSTDKMFIVHIAVILAFILLQVFMHPFKNRFIGLLDNFLMLNYWLIIETYFLDQSIFLGVYIFLTVTSILALCLLIVVQVFTLKQFINSKRNQYEVIQNERVDSDVDLFRAAEARQQGGLS